LLPGLRQSQALFQRGKRDGNQIKNVWLRQTIFILIFFALLLAPA